MKSICLLLFLITGVSVSAQRDSTLYAELEEDSVFVYRLYDEQKHISCYNLAVKTKNGWFIDSLLFNDAVPYDRIGIEYIKENLKKRVLLKIHYGRDYEHSYGNGGGWGLFEDGVIIYDLKNKVTLFIALPYHASGETLVELNATEDSILSTERTGCVVKYGFAIDSAGTITISDLEITSEGDSTCVIDHREGIYLLQKGKYVRKED